MNHEEHGCWSGRIPREVQVERILVIIGFVVHHVRNDAVLIRDISEK